MVESGSPSQAERLLGKWNTDPDDLESIRRDGVVTMEFRLDGSLEYVIHEVGKRQIILLSYRVDGDAIVTDQPSKPREERTRFEVTSDDKLLLFYGDTASTHVRDSTPMVPGRRRRSWK